MGNCLQVVDMTKRLLKALVLKCALFSTFSVQLTSWIKQLTCGYSSLKIEENKRNLYYLFYLYVECDISSDCYATQAVLWYTDSLKQKTTLEEHSSLITDVRFSPSMPRLATSSFDKTVRVWDVDNVSWLCLSSYCLPLLRNCFCRFRICLWSNLTIHITSIKLFSRLWSVGHQKL